MEVKEILKKLSHLKNDEYIVLDRWNERCDVWGYLEAYEELSIDMFYGLPRIILFGQNPQGQGYVYGWWQAEWHNISPDNLIKLIKTPGKYREILCRIPRDFETPENATGWGI